MKKRTPEESGRRVLTVGGETTLLPLLLAHYPGKSRNYVKALLGRGQVTVDGRRVTQFDLALNPHHRVEVTTARQSRVKSPLPIVFEDDELIVVDKPAGLLSIATDREKEHTAYRLMTDYVRACHPDGRIFVVHRLDRDTSGLLLFAKQEEMKTALQADWSRLATHRGYLAVVEGRVTPPDGTIRSWLKQTKTLLMYSSGRAGDGQEAITNYETERSNGDYSLLRVTIETGRKNQIRVHMKELGHPVAGDTKYGAKTNPIKRVALHARRLVLTHPRTGDAMEFRTAMPKPFSALVRE